MKNLFLSAAAAAILVPLSACADQADTTTRKEQQRTETSANNAEEMKKSNAYENDAVQTAEQKMKSRDAQATTSYDQKANAQHKVTYMGANQLSAKDLLGEGIIGAKGDRIARVDDIVIGADGQADSVVFLSGGVFGLGGKRGALDFERVAITTDAEVEPVVRVSMTEEAAQSVAEYVTDEANDYRLASELIGASAKLSNSDQEATITDMIMEKDGQVRFAVVRNGVVGALGGEKRIVAFDKVVIAQGDGGVVLDVTPAILEKSDRFEYWENKTTDALQRGALDID